MGSFFSKNLEMLKELYPGMAEAVAVLPPPKQVALGKVKQNRMRKAEQYWQKRDCQGRSMVIMLGADTWEKAIVGAKVLPSNVYSFFVIAKDLDGLRKAMEWYDMTALFLRRRVCLCVGLGEDQLISYIGWFLEKGLTYTMTTGALTLADSVEFKQNKNYFTRVAEAFTYVTTTIVRNKSTNFKHAIEALGNKLGTVLETVLTPKLYTLEGCFEQVPAVVVAAGPSLDKNIEQLKLMQGKAVIIAVNTILKKLLAHGITPHFVCSMDTSDKILPYYEGIDPVSQRGTVLVTIPGVNPKVGEMWRGPKMSVLTQTDMLLFGWSEEQREVPAAGEIKEPFAFGASCGHMAYSIAAHLGCDPVILIGQDLAYGEDGSTHSTEIDFAEGSGITTREFLADPSMKRFDVPGNLTEKVSTSAMWRQFIESYKALVGEYAGRTINCTEGGAYIEGTLVAPLAEVAEDLPLVAVDIRDVIRVKTIKPSMDDAQRASAFVVGTQLPKAAAALSTWTARFMLLRQDIDLCLAGAVDGAPEALASSLTHIQELMHSDAVSRWTFTSLEVMAIATLLKHHGLEAREHDPGKLMYAQLQLHHMFAGSMVDSLNELSKLYTEALDNYRQAA